ncbi:MAG: lmo0937 family membrane protein [Myxococcales bacterium]|nr:lmo0937 family membrane protein [Myxococcales bacterium]
MLWAIAAIFVIMWVLGFSMNYHGGGLIHVLLVLAVVSVLVRIILGRRA